MKCSNCGHVCSEAAAKFCSNCGQSLSVQSTNSLGDDPKSLKADLAATSVKPSLSADGKNLTKKKKKKGRKKKKRISYTEDRSGSFSDPNNIRSEGTSDTHDDDDEEGSQTKYKKSRTKDVQPPPDQKTFMDQVPQGKPEEKQEQKSSTTEKPSMLFGPQTSSRVLDPKTSTSGDLHVAVKDVQNQTRQIQSINPQGDNVQSNGAPDLHDNNKGSQTKYKKSRTKDVQPPPDQKTFMDQVLQGKPEEKQEQKSSTTEKPSMLFGPQTSSRVLEPKTSTSGDLHVAVKDVQNQTRHVQSINPQGDNVQSNRSPHLHDDNKKGEITAQTLVQDPVDPFQNSTSKQSADLGANLGTGSQTKHKKSRTEDVQPPLDQNAIMNQEPQGKPEEKQEQKSSTTEKPSMLFGPQTSSRVLNPETSASGDPHVAAKDVQNQTRHVQSINPQGDKVQSNRTADLHDDNKKGTLPETEKSKKVDEKPPLDQNANVNQEQQGKHENKDEQKPSSTEGQSKLFGPQTPSQVDPETGSSVDPHFVVEDMQNHQANNSQSSTPLQQAPIRASMTIPAGNRLTLYFHAILSKDFKFDSEKDHIFIRAGPPLSKWEENLLELYATRNLGEHGFLVEGKVETQKMNNEAVSIPYKYVVRKKGKETFEFIYKENCNQHETNRCLFVKSHFLNEDGDWHQYDDFLCVEPPKSTMDRIMSGLGLSKFWSDQNKKIIQGRDIAADIMLDTIFDLLRTWSDINLKSFFNQLDQFFEVYANPSTYEAVHKKWNYYNKNNLSTVLKNFMVKYVTPRLWGDGNGGERLYIKDRLRAAVIMLLVCVRYSIKLDSVHYYQLCAELCLPELDRDDFLRYWEGFCHDAELLPSLSSDLLTLIKFVKHQGNPNWIVALPLLHLLDGKDAKPFQVLTSRNGLQDLGKVTNNNDRMAILQTMKTHSHLMELDPLLVRSGLNLMSLNEIKDYSINVNVQLLDILRAFAKSAPKEISYTTFQDVSGILSHIQKNLEFKYSSVNKTDARSCLVAVVNLFEKICSGAKTLGHSKDIPVSCMELVASVFDLVAPLMNQDAQEGGQHERSPAELSEPMRLMRGWMSSHFKDNLLSRNYWGSKIEATEEMKMWNRVIGIHFNNRTCQEEWKRKLLLDFEGKYKKEKPMDQIDFYRTKIEELDHSLQHVAPSIEKCALEAVSSVCQNKSGEHLFENFKMTSKFMKLLSAIVTGSWPKDHQGNYEPREEVVLQHLLSWPGAKYIFQLHGAQENLSDKLTSGARERISFAMSTLTEIKNKFMKGNITLKLLNILLASQNAFLQLLRSGLSENERHLDTGKMQRLLKCREDEVKAVYHEKQQVDALLKMIRHLDKHIEVDVTELDEKRHINMDEMHLNEFMEVHLYDQFSSNTAGVVTYFGMNEDIKQMSEDLNKFKDSHLFILCWEEESKLLYADDGADEEDDDQTREQFTLRELYEEIFTPCVENYTEIYTRLKTGTIKLEEVTRLFGDFKRKYAELEQDLNIMCRVDTSTDKQWIHTRLQQIEQYHELHLAVASAEVIMEVKETLGLEGDFSVLETLLKVSRPDFQVMELQCIDNDVVEAKRDLMDITESRRLCLKELTLRGHFVKWVKDALRDLKDLQVFVDLASISAGENDMEVDRVACFHDAVLGYSSVLYDLQPDSGFLAFKDVLKKLWKAFDNDKNLPKKLRDSGRHLEWLKTVKDSHGSVELSSMSLASAINRKGIYRICAQSGKKMSLDTALKLEIMEDEEVRQYTLEDVRELQNKLMLMSGKGDQGQNEVNYFAEVFAGVQRLSEAFIALYTAGNLLFRHWEAQIHCCYLDRLRIVMNFNMGDEITIEECLPELCVKMENCLKLWMDFVDKQRSQNYYLNYFTAEQIVYLCKSLSEEHVKNVNNQVLMMLSFIKSHCTAADVSRVWRKLQNEILTQPQEENEEVEFQGTSDPSMEMGPEQEANTFQMFDRIWKNYMKDPKRVFPHILDIKSLGKLLEFLALSEEKHGNLIKRELPKSMAAGNPNLIVCPHAAVLTSCISVYMTSKHQPLPTYDEVLLCNSSTTYEQAELFLRRCLGAGGKEKKIYCLLHGELLAYDVSSKVEKFFQRMKMQCTTDYRLVLLCSSEREHAYLPSAFSQYRLQIVPQMPLDSIRTYLHQHYMAPADQVSAADVFKDRLCVGTVTSERAGVGKSLYIQRLYEKLEHYVGEHATMNCIRLIEPSVDETAILQTLMSSAKMDKLSVFHFDITSSVKKGIHEFLFKLLILRYLMDSEGNTWKCDAKQLYVMEFLQQTVKPSRNTSVQANSSNSSFTDIFPNILCRTPKEVLSLLTTTEHDVDDNPLMDDKVFQSEAFQRPYQYLRRFHHQDSLDRYTYTVSDSTGSHAECLQMLFIYCGILDPSWAELRNFTWFLNLQLEDCETSVFCDAALTGDILNGFKKFVVGFMIVMAKDFATPSLSISDQSLGRVPDRTDLEENDLAPFLIRKEWEKEPHPYIFFNEDHSSMTFIGFYLQRNPQRAYDAIDPKTKRVIKENVMSQELFEGLRRQGVPFNIDFDTLPRSAKIEHLCHVLGIKKPFDPDPTYELTTDNILKMLAIHMRFRCGIPVIIMGETGCGKTRLIKYLCELRRSGVATENMKLVKVHGGTSSEMIYAKVREAEAMAFANKRQHGFDSVLFLDEANTTEDISSIKEVLCDKTVKGVRLVADTGLQIIAACNPYRKHTDKMIKRLESAGLGYRVRSEETDEKLGSIPLRQLVYRVQALPPSMIPLVWDFGQLNDTTEETYILQIVKRVAESLNIPKNHFGYITRALSASQKYMRERRDECSFVSLRDVERCMQAFLWFHDKHDRFFAELKEFSANQNRKKHSHYNSQSERDPVMWSLIMALGVCYHACLEQKDKYRQCVSRSLPPGYTPEKIKGEITLMQDLLLSGVPMADTIARNAALKENVFMMVICIELKIPLFLVGKPGTSKSLSKTLVADAMQSRAAHSDLFKMFKQVHLVSFQCSPHSTPDGIINIFKQCGRFQEGKDLNDYISVVVLDEIGLAEDSPKMPLKTLHPLLEEGCIDDEPSPHKKVGFIGISNWALDPAKMNRGIFVSRGDPDKKELIESAEGICSSDVMVLEKVKELFSHFAAAYIEIVHNQGNGFFGLRDYYSLIKMVYAAAKASKRKPTANEVTKAILRNFSGKDDVDAMTVFNKVFYFTPDLENISAIEFVRGNILASGQEEDCRYLLVLTRNYAALQILQQTFFADIGQPEIIFGSSFPKDQEYTQICRNINRVKICMETGQTVVLLNLQNLYESLYDALNQYYVYLGGQKYVDLGLGTHRVKCRVHNDFRLIVIEEREVVYKQFPIPLINRLEKHYLDIHTVLTTEQRRLVEELEEWVKRFVSVGNLRYKYRPSDVFVGYHSDACASVIHQVIGKTKDAMEITDGFQRVVHEAKHVLLRCATPDSVVRLSNTDLPSGESEDLANVYFEELSNSCLADFIDAHTRREVHSINSFTEVTTFSRLLTAPDLEPLQRMFPCVELLSLQQFDTEHFFLKEIRNFLTAGPEDKVLIIQSEFKGASHSAHLVASAKYSAVNEVTKLIQEGMTCRAFIYFITRLPRIQGGTSYVGFHGEPWTSVHIDDLRRPKDITKGVRALLNTTICQLFESNQPEALETGEMGDSRGGNEEEADMSDDYEEDDAALDTTALVKSCAQSAVGMLRDQQGHGSRGTERLETLLLFLSDSDQITCDFLQIVKKRLYLMLASESHLLSAEKDWAVKVASSIDALQEGGTFCHTLWKRIQAVVTPILAQLLSVIDADRNLDLLKRDCSVSVRKLWLHIFASDKLLEIPLPSLESETRTILVRNQGKNFTLSMPFSGRIKDYLEEHWVHVLQNEGHTQQRFIEFFSKTPLGQYISEEAPQVQSEFFQLYLQDFLILTMNISRQEDLELLHLALNSCVDELRSQLDGVDTVPSLPWVHVAYHQFKNRLQNLSRMVSLEPQVTGNLISPDFSNGDELVVDVYAALACLEHLGPPEPGQLVTDSQRQAWVRRVNKLKIPIELVCSENSVRGYKDRSKIIVNNVRSQWNRLFSLSLFAEHFETQQCEMTTLIVKHMLLINEALKHNSDLKTQQPFEAMIRLLKNCKDEAVFGIFRFTSLPWCAVCRGDPQDPVCLPCEHIFFCASCINKCLVPCQMNICPHCNQEVPEDFTPVPSEDLRIRVERHALFRNQCNAFFIDLVSSVCFKDNSPPCDAVIHHLLSFLMVEASAASILSGDRQTTTKVLSPFDDSADRNPVVRSVVLKLLLKYSFDDVKDYLQHHLLAVEWCQILEEKDKTKLYCLYLKCLQDSMFESFQVRSNTEKQACMIRETDFLTKLQLLLGKSPDREVVTVEHLQQVARVRMDLDLAATIITTEPDEVGWSQSNEFLASVRNLCSLCGDNWYRVYLLRKIISQRGGEFVLQLLQMDDKRWLFPEEILEKGGEAVSVDQYLVYGESYKKVRDAVSKAIAAGQMENLDEICQDCTSSLQSATVCLLLALYREVTIHFKNAHLRSHQNTEQILNFIDNSKVLADPKVKAFARVLVNNQFGALEVGPQTSGEDCASMALAVHLAAVLLCACQRIITPLRGLAMEPATMQAAYLPTMPQDKLAEAQQALASLEPLRWYKCPNGHPCLVGECGLPMETQRCLDCNAPIGGVQHKPVEDFNQMERHADRTQTGHILGEPDRRDNADMLDTKHLSSVPFTLIRMLTHLAMLIGASGHSQNIASIISPRVSEPGPFLLAHLKKDKEHLGRYLGKGTDDVVGSVHLLIRALLKAQRPQSSESWTLSTNAKRNEWETQMSLFIAPELRHLDSQLKEMNKFIQTDSENSDNPIMWLLSDDPAYFMASLGTDHCLQCSAVWSCEENVSLLHLTHVVELNDGRETLPVLWRFLNKEAELRLVRHLPDIVSLQKALLKQFLNVTRVSYGTMAQFLNSQTGSLRTWYEKHIKIFLTTWNQLRSSLETYDEIKVPAEFCQRDLDSDSDLKVLLPQRHGPGLCSTALVSYLIGLHNDLVRCVNNHTGEETSYEVSPEDLTDLHVIHYDPEKDVMPLVLANTQYSVERGQESLHEYDLPRIQKQIFSRFLLGKPIITLKGIPTLVNRPDRDYDVILKDVKEKVRQEPLTTQTMAAVAEELHNFSEACEALSALEVALGFLRMGGQDPHMRLSDYLRDVLQMGNQISDDILKVLSWCYLKHCVVLWQLLTALKSETMLMLNGDPFEKVCKEYKGELCEELRHMLTTFFSRNSTEMFLLELHELLWLVLKNPTAPDVHRPHWSLIWSLDPAEEDKYPGFPEEICLTHAVETWKFINAIKHERIHRRIE
ncbi:E3 ubiquitin-protein ligase rnf213-alpha-like isoform X2 [Corythoichthys intestinalis]|uniref:E3 ubiquitin-protein ligase rnf213-alpha-like isoform X2 n=1 Tax=Corythoichthys intestinalis TaxID=161448 RepID=UPI0025A54769|nr:E3 ubiquitin-protein ligase rnf213-alpha-like isoform X2 [Corythoichthys intestinalis]